MSTEDLQNISAKKLDSLTKKQLVELIFILREENADLKKYNDCVEESKKFIEVSKEFMEETKNFEESCKKRMEDYERNLNLHMQYNRRESVVITGIPLHVKNNKLEDEVINIFNAAGVYIHGSGLSKFDIVACHRLNSKGKTIVRLVNRKFTAILFNGKALRGHENYRQVYVNNSFIKEFDYINYQIRQAYRNKKIFSYKTKHGIPFVQFEEEGDFFEISHRNDLLHYEIVESL